MYGGSMRCSRKMCITCLVLCSALEDRWAIIIKTGRLMSYFYRFRRPFMDQ